MATAAPFMPASTTTRRPDQLRLAACPRCEGRRRALSEEAGGLVARCLGCGQAFERPLATIREPQVTLLGRAGQRMGAAA